MSRITYFIAGHTPTESEQSEIDALNALSVSLRVRTNAASALYGEALEPADYVAGSPPAAYSGYATYSDGDVGTVLYFVVGELPTAGEQAEIDAISANSYDVLVRSLTGGVLYGEKVETTDLVSGTVPTEYEALPVFSFGGPIVDTAPTVSPSVARVGTEVTRTQGVYSARGGGTVSVSREFRVAGAQVATGATYTPVIGDHGLTLVYVETATETGGTDDGVVTRTVTLGSVLYALPVAGSIANVNASLDTGDVTVNLAAGFTGTNLTYTATRGSVSGSNLLLATSVLFDGTVTVTANDPDGQSAQTTFDFVVVDGPELYNGVVLSEHNGQSNAVGTNNIDGLMPISLQGQYDRVQITNPAHLNDPVLNSETETLTVVETGETVDGVTGKVTEFGSPNGISAVTGRGVFVADDPLDISSYLPGGGTHYVIKNGNSGTPQSSWVPGGGGFNTSDAWLRQVVAVNVASNDTRISDFVYAQGEADAQSTATSLESSLSTTDPATIIPAALTEDVITNFGARLADTRRAKREYFGIATVPYIIAGLVLPDRDLSENYDGNAERIREAVTTQYKNIARYEVELSGDETSVTVTDLGLFNRTISYDAVSDTFTENVTGTLSPYKDNNTYLINARGYNSPDSLHHGVSAQLKIGAAMKLLAEDIYGAGGNPPASHTITEVKPIFYVSPNVTAVTDTVATINYTASEAGTIYVGAYVAGSQVPSVADVIAGTGATSATSASCARRTNDNLLVSGLDFETTYDFYAVIDFGGVRSVVPAAASATTLAEITSPFTYIGETSGTYDRGTTGNVQTLALPGGLQQGDVVVVQMGSRVGIDGALSDVGVSSAGWVEVVTSGVAAVGLSVWYKVMGATPDTSVDLFEVDGNRWSAITKAWRGNIASPIDGSAVVRVYGGTTGPTPDPITTSFDNTLVVASMLLDDDDVASEVTAPGGYTDLTAVNSILDQNPGSQGHTSAIAARVVDAAGEEAPGAWGVGSGSDAACVSLFAIRSE